MTVYQRIKKILFSLCMLGVALFFFLNPSDTAYKIVVAILSLGLAIAGIKEIDTGYLVMCDDTVSIDIVMIKGIGNVLFGGEGLFNTVVTGPGHVILQTQPLLQFAVTLAELLHLNKK